MLGDVGATRVEAKDLENLVVLGCGEVGLLENLGDFLTKPYASTAAFFKMRALIMNEPNRASPDEAGSDVGVTAAPSTPRPVT